MYALPEQFAAQQQANVALALNAAHILVDGTEKLLHLNLAALRQAVGDGARTARALTEGLQDPNAGSAQPPLDALMAYSKSLYEIAAQTQADLHKLVEARFADLNQDFMAQLDQVSKSAPAGSEAVVAMFKNSVAAANSAYDTLSKAAKQVAEATEANVAHAATAAPGGAKKKAAKA
ncbi:MAG: TIGR01841 family phasin [Pseudomonadota bacterium]